MIFIDAGYVRDKARNAFKNDLLDYELLKDILATILAPSFFLFEIIRVYYYDALDSSSLVNQIYVKSIKRLVQFEDRLGTLKLRKDRTKTQKEVDTLIAIDMLSKAYQDQFVVAILIAGDRDFAPLVDYVKNTGKRVYGVYFPSHISEDLKEKFDQKFELEAEWLISERIRKDIMVEVETKFDTITKLPEYIITIDYLLRAKIPLSLHLVGLNSELRINSIVSTDIKIDYSNYEKLSKLGEGWRNQTVVTLTRQKEFTDDNEVLFLLVSDRRRDKLLENITFFFDFTYDYYYRDLSPGLNIKNN